MNKLHEDLVLLSHAQAGVRSVLADLDGVGLGDLDREKYYSLRFQLDSYRYVLGSMASFLSEAISCLEEKNYVAHEQREEV